jgi:hypothetical protein
MELTPEEQERWNEHQAECSRKRSNSLPPEKAEAIVRTWNEKPSINHVMRETNTGFVPAKRVLKSRGLIR